MLILIQLIACDCSFLFIYVTFLLLFHKNGVCLTTNPVISSFIFRFNNLHHARHSAAHAAHIRYSAASSAIFFWLVSSTASVVKNIEATDAACCSAERVTLVG